MADELTTNYGFLCPKPLDTMSQRVALPNPFLSQNLRDVYERIEAAANPTVIANPPLPQVGNYELGDRVYLSNASYQSSFILISKSATWGWIWRPVQASYSPWIDVPASAISGADSAGWGQHPTRKFAFMLSNKGNCHWRGALRKTVVGLPNLNSLEILASLPNGLKHHTNGLYTLAIDPATPQADLGLIGYKGGRWYSQSDGYNSLRFHNAGTAQDVYFDGVEYVASSTHYYSP